MFFLLFIIFLIFLYCNLFTPLFPADDYLYSYIWQWDSMFSSLPVDAVKIASWSDWLTSLTNHYFMWSGRIVNHIFVMFFVWKDKIWFDIFNSIVTVLLLVFLCYFGNKCSFQFTKKHLYFAFVSLWVFQLEWGDVFLWLSGSCNYLWSSIFIFIFLLPYILSYYCPDSFLRIKNKFSYLFLPVLFLLGLIAGNTNENVILSLFFTLGLYFLFKIYKKEHIEPWEIFGYVGLLIGFTILMISPGNANRLVKQMLYTINFSSNYLIIDVLKPILVNIQNGFSWVSSITNRLVFYNLNIFLITFFTKIFLWIFVLFYYLFYLRSLIGNCDITIKKYIDVISIKDKHFITFLLLNAIICDFVMLFSPAYPLRTGFFSLLYLIIISLILIRNNFYQLLYPKFYVKGIVYFVNVVFVLSFVSTFVVFPFMHSRREEWIQNIKDQDKTMSNSLIVADYCDSSPIIDKIYPFTINHCNIFGVLQNEDSWINTGFVRYHHLNNKIKMNTKKTVGFEQFLSIFECNSFKK